jgi:hypothetical protein
VTNPISTLLLLIYVSFSALDNEKLDNGAFLLGVCIMRVSEIIY